MRTLTILLVGLVLGCLVPTWTMAQVFFNSENNSGQITPMSPGMAYYSDRTQSGLIIEMSPGVTWFGLTGDNGQPGQTGIAVDMTPRPYTPTPDPMTDTLMRDTLMPPLAWPKADIP